MKTYPALVTEDEAGWESDEVRAKGGEGATCEVKREGETGMVGERGRGVKWTEERQSRKSR